MVTTTSYNTVVTKTTFEAESRVTSVDLNQRPIKDNDLESAFLNCIRCEKAQKLRLSEKLRKCQKAFFAVRVGQRDGADAQFVRFVQDTSDLPGLQPEFHSQIFNGGGKAFPVTCLSQQIQHPLPCLFTPKAIDHFLCLLVADMAPPLELQPL